MENIPYICIKRTAFKNLDIFNHLNTCKSVCYIIYKASSVTPFLCHLFPVKHPISSRNGLQPKNNRKYTHYFNDSRYFITFFVKRLCFLISIKPLIVTQRTEMRVAKDIFHRRLLNVIWGCMRSPFLRRSSPLDVF